MKINKGRLPTIKQLNKKDKRRMKITEEQKQKGYLHFFDLEMYILICMSYMFGFGAGWIKAWILPISLLFLGIPYYIKYKRNRK